MAMNRREAYAFARKIRERNTGHPVLVEPHSYSTFDKQGRSISLPCYIVVHNGRIWFSTIGQVGFDQCFPTPAMHQENVRQFLQEAT